MKKVYFVLAVVLIVFAFIAYINIVPPYSEPEKEPLPQVSIGYFDYTKIPEFDGEKPYVVVNDNNPYFDEKSYTTNSYEEYGKLDNKGRCTYAMACIGKDLMPTEERGSIGSVKPTGWQISKYDFIDGTYLYNRCHLIGYQLTAENANKSNLITGTRYMNVQGMLPFENMVVDYIKETDNHVLYRATPIFLDNEMVARGVLMEAVSIEDDGEGICFNVFCYNVQPKVQIDYITGDNYTEEENKENTVDSTASYILNTSSRKFHNPDCASVDDIVTENKKSYKGTRENLILDGYSPCGKCKP
ncbi:MAG: DNA/RNA non-specific endonuclease [Clostridia bacterium]|nr:DNA/RNA non-specific endonuclease [Clostridia bacterium]